MGSPRVFHTAPPQPSSNARITWSAQFAGGPDASQNGLGDLIPANSIERSGIRRSDHGERRAFAIGHRVHYFTAAIHDLATRIALRIPGAARGAIPREQAFADIDT